MKYSHAPENYLCPFCFLVQGIENEHVYSVQSDIIYQDKFVTAFIGSHQWPRNHGNTIVVPNEHFENIYDLPLNLSSKIYELSRDIALAMKAKYRCDGILLRQHNEPAGGQNIWHYHLHVIPRYEKDDFHNSQKVPFEAEERARYAQKLRNWFNRLDKKENI